MKISSLDKSIKELLGSSFFYVPRFQRPYAWDQENLEEFWTDTVVNSDADYFIGSIVTYAQGDARAIVDGQQRITTILIILAAIRESFKAAGLTARANGIQNLIERKDIENEDRFVLKTETSYPFFQDHILRNGNPELDKKEIDEEDKLKDAFNFFVEKCKGLIASIDQDTTLSSRKRQDKKELELSHIRDKILALRTISVELDSEDDAYVIFETLNTRGQDLTPGQLAKNLFARLLKPRNRQLDAVAPKWKAIQETLETSVAEISLDSFLLHHWVSKYEYVNRSRLYKSIKQHVVKATAAAVLDELVTDAKLYRSAFEPSFHKWRSDELEIRHSLEGLAVMRVRQPAPLVLAILRTYQAKSLSKKNATAALAAIENFHFTYTAMSSKSSSGGMSLMYASLAQKVSREDPNAVISELKRKLRERWPSYAEFESGFIELRTSSSYTKDRRLVKYVLAKMERAERGRSATPLREEDETIEHLEAQSTKGSIDESHVASIGNLCLVSKTLNETELANKTPAAKAVILKRNAVSLLADFHSRASQWDQAAIGDRARALSHFAFANVWTKP